MEIQNLFHCKISFPPELVLAFGTPVGNTVITTSVALDLKQKKLALIV
jgi:hypothetical protein